jgi:glycosyltransferase involved in cell wall biosynthesis
MSGSAYHVGGMERVMQQLGRNLTRYGLAPTVVIPPNSSGSYVLDWLAKGGVNVKISNQLHALSMKRPDTIFELARYIRAQRPEIVNLHSPGEHVPLAELIAVRLAGSVAVTSIHGHTTSEIGRATKLRNSILGSPLNAQVVAMNQIVKAQQIASGIAPHKLTLIYNGVDLPSEELSAVEARRQLDVPDSAFVIVCFGRLVPDKGIDTLIQAVNLLPDPVLGRLCVLIGGEGIELENLRGMVAPRAKHVVRFLGHVGQTSTCYSAADLFVLPSRHEPFGLVFLEAAAHGLPSIGTRVGGVPETILDGATGLLVRPEDPRALADAIIKTSTDDDLRLRLGLAAKARVGELFTSDLMVRGYATLFRNLLGRSKGKSVSP